MNHALRILSGYGALELKRAYHRNMATGIIIACGIHLIIIGGVLIGGMFEKQTDIPIGIPVESKKIEIGRPPIIDFDIPQRGVAPNMAAPNIGVPTAVPDEEVPDDIEFATQDEIEALINSVPVINIDEIGSENIIIPENSEVMPAPTEYIFYEEAPEVINRATPIYPEIARRAGLTCNVWLDVLIDKNGEVRDVRVVKCSAPDVGFEEAAIESAYKSEWKPAISGNHPVAVWTTYKISFILSN